MKTLLRSFKNTGIIKNCFEKSRSSIFYFLHLFYTPYFHKEVLKAVTKQASESHIFLLRRTDFGTYIQLLHYIACWQAKRGQTTCVILAPHFLLIKKMTSFISPKTTLIFPLQTVTNLFCRFFKSSIFYQTMGHTYAHISVNFPQAICLYEQTAGSAGNRSNYISFLDSHFECGKKRFSPAFCHSYLRSRKVMDCRQNFYLDYFKLYYESDPETILTNIRPLIADMRKQLQLEGEYVVININTKKYNLGLDGKKTIFFPQRYNVIIDALINKGFSVVIQGRTEQPDLKPRPGLINYAKSPYASIELDLALYAGCRFAICSSSAIENFTTLCNVPLLGLNFVELASMQPNIKMRFYPKHLQNNQTGDFLSWKEVISHPSYFDLGLYRHDPNIHHIDMSEEEMLAALEEFLPLTNYKTNESWLRYSTLQEDFKNSLHPMHMDLYYIKSVPCDSYLKNPRLTN